jgi:hypothetical protein
MSVPDAPHLETLGNTSQLAIGTVLPFSIIIFSNVWIIIVLRSASQERSKMGVSKGGQETREKETTYLTRMLILVSIAYVITSIPYRLYDIIMGMPEINSIYEMQEEYWNLRFYDQHFILAQVWITNYAINFYLYCIGGGKKYRNDARKRLGEVISCFQLR